MLVSMNAQRLYELIHYFAKEKNKYILVIDTSIWMTLSDDKKSTVKTYYEDILPVDEIGEIFTERYTFYEFNDQSSAIDTANEWFPLLTQLDDQDYFIECYVVNPSGSMPYGNKTTKNPN
tara:strand:+ start:127 stop:486 length:360 start_codon:yes stop_codon:yes gene_type:complete